MLLGDSKCQGCLWTLENFNVPANSYLDQHNISTHGRDVTISDIILNKLIPEQINVSKLKDIDICDGHRKRLTLQHKSLRQKNCAIKDCPKLGEQKRRRISLEASYTIYQKTNQHIPAGAIMCNLSPD